MEIVGSRRHYVQCLGDPLKRKERGVRRVDETYSFSNRMLVQVMRMIDRILQILAGPESSKRPADPPKRLLIANGAGLGDVLIATSILPHLRSAIPEIEVGFLVGSWAKPIVTKHPYVQRVHFIDSPLMNRSDAGVGRKLWRGLTSTYKGLKDIRQCKYDAVVDLHFNLGNYAGVLWLAGIPRRIGYVSGGFGPLLTERHRWQNSGQAIGVANARLFRSLGIHVDSVELLTPVLPSGSLVAGKKVDRLLQEHELTAGMYVVVHVGTGAAFREWPVAHWRELIALLLSRGVRVVCTGAGGREQALIAESCCGLKDVVNLCDAIGFAEYLEVVRLSALVIGVESLSGHVAAGANVPSVQIYSGVFATETWRPLNKRSRVLTQNTPCNPCGRRRGCVEMTCVRGVSPRAVLAAADEFLPVVQAQVSELAFSEN